MDKQRRNGQCQSVLTEKELSGSGRIKPGKRGTPIMENGFLFGKTRAEVRKRMTEAQAKIDSGTFIAPSSITVAEWLEYWQNMLLRDVKASTKQRYGMDVRLYILPNIGKVKLSALKPLQVTALYNAMQDKGLSTKSIRNLHGTLHKAFQQAVIHHYLLMNPCDGVTLPRSDAPKKEMRPLKDGEIKRFRQLDEHLYCIAILTGMRESELIGLTWDCIDFWTGKVHLYRQLSRGRSKGEKWHFTTLKNNQTRTFIPPAEVMSILKQVRRQQGEWRLKAGKKWTNEEKFVFTDEYGNHLSMYMVYKNFKRIVNSMELAEVRFHDLRHTYATLSIQQGMDYKTLSHNMGHATVAFTMDIYGHVTDEMMQAGADKLQQFIHTSWGTVGV